MLLLIYHYHIKKSVKLSLICLDFCRPKKLFAEDSDDAGRAGNCASHAPFCLGVRGLPVRSLYPAPPHPPASGTSVSGIL